MSSEFGEKNTMVPRASDEFEHGPLYNSGYNFDNDKPKKESIFYYYVETVNDYGEDVRKIVNLMTGEIHVKTLGGITNFLKEIWENLFVLLSFLILPLGFFLPALIRSALIEPLIELIRACGKDEKCGLVGIGINNFNKTGFMQGIDKCHDNTVCYLKQLFMPKADLTDINFTGTKVTLLMLLTSSIIFITASSIADKKKFGPVSHLKISKTKLGYVRVFLINIVVLYLLPQVAAYVANDKPGRHVSHLAIPESLVFTLFAVVADFQGDNSGPVRMI